MTRQKLEAHYDDLTINIDSFRKTLFLNEDLVRRLVSAHHYSTDLQSLSAAKPVNHAEILYNEAVDDFNSSLHSAISGNIRIAYVHLRFFIEKFSAYIQLSGNETAFRKWSMDSDDIRWNQIYCPDNGILSLSFCKAYNSGLQLELRQFQALAKILYRELSEFVHGNYKTIGMVQGTHNKKIDAILVFLDRVESATRLAFFIWCVRFVGTDYCDRDMCHDIVYENFSHLEPIRIALTRDGV